MKKQLTFWIVLSTACLLIVTTALAQDTGDIPNIIIEATAEGFIGPDELPEGIVQITFVNNSEAPVGPLLARLNEGVTFEDLDAAIAEGGEEAALSLVSLLGVAMVMPETTVDVTFDLAPGTYLLANEGGEGSDESAFLPFTVAESEGEGAVAPEADLDVVLVDFAFGMPIEIPAGPQLWHIENRGTQPHEMIIVPLDDDMPAREFNELLMQSITGEGGDEPNAPEPVIFWAMSPGEQAWLTYDLEPGTYGVVCAFPDTTGSGHVHAELGMRQTIIVTE